MSLLCVGSYEEHPYNVIINNKCLSVRNQYNLLCSDNNFENVTICSYTIKIMLCCSLCSCRIFIFMSGILEGVTKCFFCSRYIYCWADNIRLFLSSREIPNYIFNMWGSQSIWRYLDPTKPSFNRSSVIETRFSQNCVFETVTLSNKIYISSINEIYDFKFWPDFPYTII